MRQNAVHLVRRAVGSFSNRPVGPDGSAVARSVLKQKEMEIWSTMDPRDQRHSLRVLARLDLLVPGAPREVRAAALLHDVGKTASGLGWTMRIVATMVGPRGARFAKYFDHERIGARMIAAASDAVTVDLVAGTATGVHAAALKAADDL